MPNEPWDWGKALNGLVDPVRFLKSAFMGLQVVICVVVCYILFVGGVALWKKWVPVPKPPKPAVVQPTNQTITGGANSKADLSSGERTNKFGVITF